MKKLLILLAMVIIIIIISIVKYYSYKLEYNILMKENAEFEQYKDKEVNGLSVATIINKAIDKNTKNEIEKDDKGVFIQNNTNSILIELYMADNKITYKMEQIYNAGIEQFVQYYSNINFKCLKIEYHKNTGKIKYILFEQLQTS